MPADPAGAQALVECAACGARAHRGCTLELGRCAACGRQEQRRVPGSGRTAVEAAREGARLIDELPRRSRGRLQVQGVWNLTITWSVLPAWLEPALQQARVLSWVGAPLVVLFGLVLSLAPGSARGWFPLLAPLVSGGLLALLGLLCHLLLGRARPHRLNLGDGALIVEQDGTPRAWPREGLRDCRAVARRGAWQVSAFTPAGRLDLVRGLTRVEAEWLASALSAWAAHAPPAPEAEDEP